MGDAATTELINNRDFLEDCARFSEQILTQDQIVRKYRLDDAMLERLSKDDALVEAVERIKTQRVRSRTAAAERAQNHYSTIPDELNKLARDPNISPRFRIDASRELRVCAQGPETAPAAASMERFQITINLGNGEVVRYDQPKIVDNKATTEDAADQLDMELIPFVAAKKRNEGNGGEFL
jgi:hypothetical protein